MALTPEQVINKTFQPTKFREGYDQEEVDLFLDEVVAELRRLNTENEDLRQQLSEAGVSAPVSIGTEDETVSEPVRTASDDAADSSEDVQPEAQAEEPVEAEAPAQEPEPLPAVEEQTADQPAPAAPAQSQAAPAASDSSSESAAAVIAMAQRLHDEYVAQGEAERQRLIDEGQSAADSLVSDAETRRQDVLASLEEAKRSLETDVESLRGFESSYRAELRSYLKERLDDLENGPSLEPVS
ncbi:DivIVA domain-containing protein [Rothia halotolerans]|uniref:DivIVA domain-containing protein n=1 Tax=Rothia halotolerans TaxID=405770 RepID=UPI00101DD243|nr:DivIVA domain-containing protein [Rothia halotolerans]